MINRKRLAYKTALHVTFSYLWLNLKSRFLGDAYKQRKLSELHEQNAIRVKVAILELQGLFIKFGQLVSILANILPESFCEPLASLQDKIPARSYDEVAKTFTDNIGSKPEDIFSSFDTTPIAAASIGQVHLAVKDGVRYAVKIQHANIHTIAKEDLQILKHLLAIHSWFFDVKGSNYLYEQMEEMVMQELDYTKESDAMQAISENIKKCDELDVIVPKIHSDLSNNKVLVSEYFEGKNIADLEQLAKWNIQPKALAERLLLLFANMILVDGYYHADPHPGNFLINAQGEIALLDFGAVSKLSDDLREGIPELIEAVIRNDTATTVQSLEKMNFLVKGEEAKQVAERLVLVGRHFMEEEVQLDGLDFSSIKLKSGFSSVTTLLQNIDLPEISSAVQIPKDCILLYRAVILLFGVSFQLAPEHNPIETIHTFAKAKGLGGKADLQKLILLAIKRQLATALALPASFESFLKKSNAGQLEIKLKNLDENVQRIYHLGQQFLFATMFGFFYVMGSNGYSEMFFWGAGITSILFLKVWWLGRK